jgi:hypothetical protein
VQDEQVVGVIPMAHAKTGMFSSKAFTLVFTTHRLIVAEARKDLVKEQVERSRAEARNAGSGTLGQWGAHVKASNQFGAHYLGWDPEAILAETPGNVAVTPGEVRGFKVDRRSHSTGGDDGVDLEYLHVTLETAGGKRTYDTDLEHPNLDQARALVAAFTGLARGAS